ncbi:MAG: J domain-containing protein [Desulfobacter sp.]
MYLAKVKKDKAVTYILRESVPAEGEPGFRDIYDLGPSPGTWIDYPGGNAWYLSPDLESSIAQSAREYDPDLLEDLFWPFIRPDIRKATQTFRQRSPSGFKRMSKREKEAVARATHAFDKRRAHFLKFGNMDQGPLVNIPAVLFRTLQNKSRDEIEQGFMAQEMCLKPKELKSYVYTIFDLQRFFKGFMAKKMPHVLDQDKVETYFIQEVCLLNSTLFHLTDRLHEYMLRYVIMFFDHSYEGTVLLEEMERDFRFRARDRFFNPPPKSSVPLSRARQIFNLGRDTLKTMDKKSLTRHFRKLAREHHPDRGGDHDRFVEINEAYQALLEKIAPAS